MKKVVSISLGSSKGDKTTKADFLGTKFEFSRIGTNGNEKLFRKIIQRLDKEGYDAFGLGGADIFLSFAELIVELFWVVRLIRGIKTPIADGSGLKHTLEPYVIKYIDKNIIPISGKKVLIVSAVDRYGMAKTFHELGCEVLYGDFIFTLGLNWPIYSYEKFEKFAKIALRIVQFSPISWFYPTGKNQDKDPINRFWEYYNWADIIAGDGHLIRKYLPDNLQSKLIITNTVTNDHIELFKKRKLSYLVTTTPNYGGRSYGTNLIEAIFSVLLSKHPRDISSEEYLNLITQLNYKPELISLA